MPFLSVIGDHSTRAGKCRTAPLLPPSRTSSVLSDISRPEHSENPPRATSKIADSADEPRIASVLLVSIRLITKLWLSTGSERRPVCESSAIRVPLARGLEWLAVGHGEAVCVAADAQDDEFERGRRRDADVDLEPALV